MNIRENMKVSICIAVYGVEQYIERCARSVFEQTYSEIEFIFVNDCTKDKSIEVLEKVVDEYPGRKEHVRIICHEHNKGLAGARNTAVENATGDFIFWLDSDDYLDVTAIDKVVKKQMHTNADIIITDFLKLCNGYNEYVAQKNTENPQEFVHKILRDECEHWLCGKLIRLSLYKKYGIKALEGANMGEDFQVCPQLMSYANKLAYVAEPLYIYDMRNVSSYGHSVTESVQWQRWQSYDVVKKALPYKEYKDDLEFQQMQMCYFQLKSFYKSPQTLSVKYYNYLIERLQEITHEQLDNYVFYKRFLLKSCLKIGTVTTITKLPLSRIAFYVDIINALNEMKKKFLFIFKK